MLQKVETLLNFQRIQDLCIIEILQLSSFTLNCKRLNWKYKYNSNIWTDIVIVISPSAGGKIIMTVNTRFGQYWQMTIKIWQLVGHKILFTITRTEVFIGSLYTNCRRASRTLLFDLRDGKYELTTQYWNCVSTVSHSYSSYQSFSSQNKADKA